MGGRPGPGMPRSRTVGAEGAPPRQIRAGLGKDPQCAGRCEGSTCLENVIPDQSADRRAQGVQVRQDPVVDVSVRPASEDDRQKLLSVHDARARLHHEERILMQDRGEATYLVAWRGDEPCGRATLFHCSKYDGVRRLLGVFPELNALEATPQGEGIGSQIIACAESVARSMDQSLIGLAVEHENVRPRQLYERIGFRDWGEGDVVDRCVSDQRKSVSAISGIRVA